MAKPKIRFKGFSEDWEQRKLGELYTERNERGNDSLQILSVSIHSGVSDGELNEESLGKIVRRSKDKAKYKRVYSGDLIFNMMRAWQGAIGVAKTEGMVSPAYISAIPNEVIYPEFMNYLLRRKVIIGQINNLSYGVTDFRKRLYWNSFSKVMCQVPSTEEQKNIGEFFSKLDHLITLHQRKCDEIKTLKKYMLQKMFPEKGKRVPEIRFDGFTEDWEQRKLGKVADIVTGKLDANAMNETGEYDFYTSGIQKYKIDVPAFEGPAITIAGNGATVGYMHLANGKFNAYQRTYVLSAFQANREFLFYEIGNKLPKKISQEARTGNIPYIVMDMLTDLQLSIPCEQEQRKLGEFMMSLDHLITLHQHKCEELQKLKKFMLQNMFV